MKPFPLAIGAVSAITLIGCVSAQQRPHLTAPQYFAMKGEIRRHAIEERSNALKREVLRLESEREREQGSVRYLSDNTCARMVTSIRHPPDAAGLMANDDIHSPYYTPQENWCRARLQRFSSPADNRFPGMLPEGATATPLGNGHWLIRP